MIHRTQAYLRLSALAALALASALPACSRQPAEQGDADPQETPGPAAAADCDQACLIDLLDAYLDAVVARAPENAPLAPDFRSTENAMEVAPGAGVWASVTGLGALQRRYADPETNQAVYVGLVGEGQATSVASLRIRVETGLISEAEWVIARQGNPAGFIGNPPPEALVNGGAREAAIAAADSYFDGIEMADGGGVIAYPDCFRIANGTWTVGRIPERPPVDQTEAQPGFNTALVQGPTAACIGGFQRLGIQSVSNRRYLYDEQAGMLWAGAVLERADDAADDQGRALPWVYVSNLFQIEDGRIRGIYSTTISLPGEIRTSGWPDNAATP